MNRPLTILLLTMWVTALICAEPAHGQGQGQTPGETPYAVVASPKIVGDKTRLEIILPEQSLPTNIQDAELTFENGSPVSAQISTTTRPIKLLILVDLIAGDDKERSNTLKLRSLIQGTLKSLQKQDKFALWMSDELDSPLPVLSWREDFDTALSEFGIVDDRNRQNNFPTLLSHAQSVTETNRVLLLFTNGALLQEVAAKLFDHSMLIRLKATDGAKNRRGDGYVNDEDDRYGFLKQFRNRELKIDSVSTDQLVPLVNRHRQVIALTYDSSAGTLDLPRTIRLGLINAVAPAQPTPTPIPADTPNPPPPATPGTSGEAGVATATPFPTPTPISTPVAGTGSGSSQGDNGDTPFNLLIPILLAVLGLAGVLAAVYAFIRRRPGASNVPAAILIGKQAIPLGQSPLSVGRAQLGPGDGSVVDQHARLSYQNNRWVIELDKGHQMRVAGRLSRKNRLNDGAVVILGSMASEASFTFRDVRLMQSAPSGEEAK